MTNATALGLFNYVETAPDQAQIRRAYDWADEKLKELGLTPSYFGSGGYLKMKKYGGALHKRTLVNNFAPTKDGVLGFSIYCNPLDSDEPSYDYYALATYSYRPSSSVVTLNFYAEEQYLPSPSPVLDKLLVEMTGLQPWDFGQGLTRPVKEEPYMHLICGKRRDKSEETRRQDKWYATYQPSERLTRVRDVYPYNMLNARQLAYPVADSTTLRDFIVSNPFSELRPLAQGLELWTVQPEQTELVRSMLAGTGVLITE